MSKKDSKMVRVFRKAEKGVNALVSVIHDVAAVMTISLIALVAFQVIMRYVFNNPIYGIDEFVVVLLVWSSSLGFIVVTWNNEHAKIEVFLKKLPHAVNVVVYVVIYAIAFIFGYVLLQGGITLFNLQVVSATVGGLPFPRAYYYALPMMVLGALLCLLIVFRLLEYAFVRDDELMLGAPEVEEGEGGISVD